MVPDFRLNKSFDRLEALTETEKDKSSFYAMNAVIMPARTGSAVMRMSAVKIWEKVSRIIIAMLPGHRRAIVFQKQ